MQILCPKTQTNGTRRLRKMVDAKLQMGQRQHSQKGGSRGCREVITPWRASFVAAAFILSIIVHCMVIDIVASPL